MVDGDEFHCGIGQACAHLEAGYKNLEREGEGEGGMG